MKNNIDFKDLIRIEISKIKVIAIFVAALLFYIAAVILWKQNIIDNNIEHILIMYTKMRYLN